MLQRPRYHIIHFLPPTVTVFLIASYFCSTALSGSAAKFYSAKENSASGSKGNSSVLLASRGHLGYIGWCIG